MGLKFGVDEGDICKALEEYVPSNNRSQLKQTERNTLIIDAYNANPTSMHAALKNFAEMHAANKMVILGEMGELGAESEEEHQKLLDEISHDAFEKVWLIGGCFEKMHTAFRTFHTVDDVIEEIKRNTPKGYTILIKGSNSNKLFRLPEYL